MCRVPLPRFSKTNHPSVLSHSTAQSCLLETVGPNLTYGVTGGGVPSQEGRALTFMEIQGGARTSVGVGRPVLSLDHTSFSESPLPQKKRTRKCRETKHFAQGLSTNELRDWDSGRFWRILESGFFCLPCPTHPPRRDRRAHRSGLKSRFRTQKGEKGGAGWEKLWVIDRMVCLT